jgi:hypothetical protein
MQFSVMTRDLYVVLSANVELAEISYGVETLVAGGSVAKVSAGREDERQFVLTRIASLR